MICICDNTISYVLGILTGIVERTRISYGYMVNGVCMLFNQVSYLTSFLHSYIAIDSYLANYYTAVDSYLVAIYIAI